MVLLLLAIPYNWSIVYSPRFYRSILQNFSDPGKAPSTRWQETSLESVTRKADQLSQNLKLIFSVFFKSSVDAKCC